MKRLRILGLLLVLVMLLGGTARAAEPILPQRAHMEVSMAELEDMRFDMDAFQDLCGELQAKCTDRANYSTVEGLLQELRNAYLMMDTELTICALNSSKHAADQAVQAEYLEKLDQSYDVDSLMNDTVLAVLDSPCGNAVDQTDMVFSMFTWELGDMTGEEEQLYLEEQTLVDQYDSACQQAFTTKINGWDYTEPEAYEAYLWGDLTWEEYDQAAQEIAVAQNGAMAGIYVALAENRKQQAALYGYGDYAQMADEYFFYRDYDREEIVAFSQAVKTYIVPLAAELDALVSECAYRGDYDISYSTEALLAMLRQGLAAVSGELLPAADYMTEYGYYDIDYAQGKSDGAYTTILSYPNAPYLLMQPEEGPWDFSTLVHEFGHYNAYFCSGNVYAANYDLSEIHSQGLELLMTHVYGDLFGGRAQAMELDTIYYVLTSLVDGCMMDELERYAYMEQDLTVEKLNRKYMELMKDYGYRDMTDPEEQGYGWVLTAHLFSDPLYYISYAVSAAGAFALWEQSLSDWDGAVETYLRLVAMGEEGDFFDTLRRVGMGNPISQDSVASLADLVRREFGLETAAKPEREPEWETEPEPAATPAKQDGPIEWNSGGAPAEEDGALPGALVLAVTGVRFGGGLIVLAVILIKRKKERRT